MIKYPVPGRCFDARLETQMLSQAGEALCAFKAVVFVFAAREVFSFFLLSPVSKHETKRVAVTVKAISMESKSNIPKLVFYCLLYESCYFFFSFFIKYWRKVASAQLLPLIFNRPIMALNLRKLGLCSEFKEALLLTTRNERNAEGSVSSRSWGATITGIKDDRVTTKTFAEGTGAVSSLGFVGSTSHSCMETPTSVY